MQRRADSEIILHVSEATSSARLHLAATNKHVDAAHKITRTPLKTAF
jgi:hypothetical protein